MRRAAEPLLLALVLLTTLPVGRWLGDEIAPAAAGRSVAWYPAVGVIVGGLLVVAAMIAASAPPWIAAVLVLAVWVVLTGGLHLDGLADAVDGAFAGHRDASRTLAVMAEPTAGPMAVIALIGVLLAKFAALATLAAAGARDAGILVTVPLFARAAAAGLMATTDYRRPHGIAHDQAVHRSRRAIGAALVIGLGFAMLVLTPGMALGLAAVTLVATAAWRRLWLARVGGYTGDVAGALIELVECLLLVVVAWSGSWD